MVISLPRTRICESNAASTALRSSSRSPSRTTMDWWPGTRIFTWVCAFAKSVRGIESFRKGVAVCDPTRLYGHSGCLPGRPLHEPAAQEVEVEMVHALSGLLPHVRDQPPADSIHPLGLGQVARGLEDLRQETPVPVP